MEITRHCEWGRSGFINTLPFGLSSAPVTDGTGLVTVNYDALRTFSCIAQYQEGGSRR